MGDPHRAVGRIDRLSTGPAGAKDVDAQLLIVDPYIHLFGLREHRNGRRRSMYAAASFGLRHALDAVHAGFELQPREDVGTADRRARLLATPETGLGKIEKLEPPASERRVSLVHAKELGGEQSRLLAAGPSAHLEDRVALIVGIL